MVCRRSAARRGNLYGEIGGDYSVSSTGADMRGVLKGCAIEVVLVGCVVSGIDSVCVVYVVCVTMVVVPHSATLGASSSALTVA